MVVDNEWMVGDDARGVLGTAMHSWCTHQAQKPTLSQASDALPNR